MYVEPFRSRSGESLETILEGARRRASSFGNDLLVQPPLKPAVPRDGLLSLSEPGNEKFPVLRKPSTLRPAVAVGDADVGPNTIAALRGVNSSVAQVHYGLNVILLLSIIGYLCVIWLHDRSMRNQIIPHVREFEDVTASVTSLKARDAQLQLEIERDRQEEVRIRAALDAYQKEYEGALQPLQQQEAALRAQLKAMKRYHTESPKLGVLGSCNDFFRSVTLDTRIQGPVQRFITTIVLLVGLLCCKHLGDGHLLELERLLHTRIMAKHDMRMIEHQQRTRLTRTQNIARGHRDRVVNLMHRLDIAPRQYNERKERKQAQIDQLQAQIQHLGVEDFPSSMSRPSNPFAQGFRRVDLEGGAQHVVSTVAAWKAQASQMSMTMDIIFFSAACCVVAASVISTIEVFLTEIAPFDLVDCIYLLLFGTKMMFLDAPVRFKGIVEAQAFIVKYFAFLTRFTGRGIWYIFLGTMTFATLWDNQIWYLGAVLLGFYVFLIGVFATVMGAMKSRKLDRNANCEQMFNSYARSSPQEGMTAEEFDLLSQVAGISFRPDELTFVLNALCNEGRLGITQRDFCGW
ncbi:hypothetical protein FOZ63_025841, partial [Perkinsus olseni]